MNDQNKINILKNEIEKGQAVLAKIEDYYNEFASEIKPDKRTTAQAIVISDLICNYYTCLETIFLRISQFFENSLTKEKWHQDLLQKMTLHITDIREAVILDDTYNLLLELLKFRHFKRYYFDFNYDWDKLDYIQKKFQQLRPQLKIELTGFKRFLDKL
jgi:hypothetical protein